MVPRAPRPLSPPVAASAHAEVPGAQMPPRVAAAADDQPRGKDRAGSEAAGTQGFPRAGDDSARTHAYPAKPALGQVYVFARSGQYYVLVDGKNVRVPALISLPLHVKLLNVRKGSQGTITQVPVQPQASQPSMLRLD